MWRGTQCDFKNQAEGVEQGKQTCFKFQTQMAAELVLAPRALDTLLKAHAVPCAPLGQESEVWGGTLCTGKPGGLYYLHVNLSRGLCHHDVLMCFPGMDGCREAGDLEGGFSSRAVG